MRFFAALAIVIMSSKVGAVACPLDDTLKLCVLNGRSLAALHSGVDRGDWKVDASFSPVNGISEPRTGSEVYTMPSGQRFGMLYRDFQNLFSATCSFDFLSALGKGGQDGMRCSNAELEAFEAGLSAASVGRITKERRQSGTAYLIEGQNTWMTVVVTSSGTPQDVSNAWVETSVVKGP
ncbi:hypothetical protein B5K08_05825 [Rhizobium leguminosarum bv. trifolii]|uniref:Uncharacterized protein n=1 Tax=Rhizobium leguminosarum bv. trifolii TaxID=386 RepID=A0A3E1C056_RHILT|nr:hypothetical protein [Rhizobium leguminosarum]RFB97873.1 hypothetical protein B5K08_05825 [Rhizobium leguminosarum bv. trifolii]RFC00110.1 hypothetical protein B5K10_05815 [Rhizobium leguminosarum bv. trifolii]